MQRLLIAAISAAFLASITAPVMADDYPPCVKLGQDHCRVVAHHSSKHHSYNHHHSQGPRGKKKP